MDSITHIALGALTGELLVGKQIGRKAFTLGALAQSFPDIDAVATLWLSPTENMLVHRGITHSILFCLLASILFAILTKRLFKKTQISLRQWYHFFIIQLCLHIFIDAFNAYGTAWFEPFSDYRIVFNTLFVVDPLFSISLLIGGISLLWPSPDTTRRKWAITCLLISTIYLSYALLNKFIVELNTKRILSENQINTNV